MIKRIIVLIPLILIFSYSTIIEAEGFEYVEIFDPQQDKIVKTVQLNEEIYNMTVNWLKDVNDIYGKFDPITDDGYAIKIPLDPAVDVQSKWLSAHVREVYIIIPEDEPPFFMVFENENKLSCLPFNGDIGALSKALNFKLKK